MIYDELNLYKNYSEKLKENYKNLVEDKKKLEIINHNLSLNNNKRFDKFIKGSFNMSNSMMNSIKYNEKVETLINDKKSKIINESLNNSISKSNDEKSNITKDIETSQNSKSNTLNESNTFSNSGMEKTKSNCNSNINTANVEIDKDKNENYNESNNKNLNNKLEIKNNYSTKSSNSENKTIAKLMKIDSEEWNTCMKYSAISKESLIELFKHNNNKTIFEFIINLNRVIEEKKVLLDSLLEKYKKTIEEKRLIDNKNLENFKNLLKLREKVDSILTIEKCNNTNNRFDSLLGSFKLKKSVNIFQNENVKDQNTDENE